MLMAKIFVVDDEKDNLTILGLYLKQRGLETYLCDKPKEAFGIIQKIKPDLVILDIMMPELDGFSLCKIIKANESTSDIPVIFLTARYLDKKDLIEGLSLGAFDYITKPFDEGELFARINAALKVRFAEKSLKAQNIMLESVLFHMSEALFFLTNEKTIIIQNHKAKELLEKHGYFEDNKLLSFGELTTETIFLSHRNESTERTISHTVKLGDECYKINSSPITITDREGLIITIDDITAELKSQEELIQSAKLISIGELAASIAHEISNPITGIIGYSELLNIYQDAIPPKVYDFITKIQKESSRVKNIVENLLKFSRRQQLMDMSYVDVAQSLKEVIFLLTTAFEENNISFNVQLDEEMPLVYCNSGLLQQAVLNLLQKAFDAIIISKKGSQISLKAYVHEEMLCIEISDDGPGIPAEIKDKIFEPFFTTKQKGKGTGFGLSFVYRITELHNGKLTFDTSEKGTKFLLSIPIHSNYEKDHTLSMKTPVMPTTLTKRALVIDDDITIREYLSDILYTFKFTVDEAPTAVEGINLLMRNDYDVIVLDIKLPDKNGIEIFNYIKENYPSKEDKVLFITGDISLDTKEQLKKTNRPFLIKPFTFSDIVNILKLK